MNSIIDLSFIRHGVVNTYDSLMFEWKMLDEKQRIKYKRIARIVIFTTLSLTINHIIADAMCVDGVSQLARDKFIFKLTEAGYSPEQINNLLNTLPSDQINWVVDDGIISAKYNDVQFAALEEEIRKKQAMQVWKFIRKYIW